MSMERGAFAKPLRGRPAPGCGMSVAVAGTPCVNWSNKGERSGMAGRANLCLMTWLMEGALQQEDIISHENTILFDMTPCGWSGP